MLILFPFLFVAQELPPILNYSHENYEGGNQNWMISQTGNKYVYVANNNGLLENDGSKWRLYPSPNGSIIRSVNVIGELIYTGSYMEFGYWKKDEFGDLIYTSLVPKLTIPLIDDEQFWNILKYNDWIIFQSLDRIYFYNTIDESFNLFSSDLTISKIFIVANSIYFHKVNEGIFKIENGNEILVTNDPITKKYGVVGAFSKDNKTLFLTDKGEFFYLNGSNLLKWNINADEQIFDKNIYCSLQLSDGNFALGTISDGIIILDENGNFLESINKEKGLSNNTILSLFEDHDNNLWLGLDNGISILNLNSPFSVYTDFKGELGGVYASKAFNNYLYLGTNQGLFCKQINTENEFELIENTEGQVWRIKEIDGVLFCGHNNGTFIIRGKNAEQIPFSSGTWDIKKIAGKDNFLLQGNYKGLSILEKINNKWTFRNKIEGFEISSRFFQFTNNGQVLVNHDIKGIFTLKINSDYSKILDMKNEISYGYGSSLINYRGNLIYSSNQNRGVYKYNLEDSKFIKDTFLTNSFYGEEDNIIGTLIETQSSSKLWGVSNKNIISIAPGKFDKTPRVIKTPISNSFRRKLGVSGFENLSHLSEESFLIGVSNGYAILDLNKLKSKEYSVKINAIYKQFQNSNEEKVSLTDNPEFKSVENNLHFYFSVPEFDKYTEVQYQYRLVGLYDSWSSWFSKPERSFYNLSHGNYTLNIRARVGNKITNNIANYQFKIEKPWFLATSMLFVYVLITLFISFFIHKRYKSYYTKKQHRAIKKSNRKLRIKNLENEQDLMKSRNDNLRLDIENKNRELGLSTMNLIKKNEFLNNIKRELKNADSKANLNYIIKIIDKNINNTDDWELFKEAFNNADKDFFKKTKLLHPSLTPNDLKLCAYLRLNLSSKEIAPLLNISAKSVEVKRYRLRKKMELPHDSNLSTYIFEI